MIGAETLMQAAERVLVGNVNIDATQERQRDRRIIATTSGATSWWTWTANAG